MITIGGGIITKKGLITFLLMSTLLLSGIAGASAATVGTVQTQNNNTTTIKENVSTNLENVTNVETLNKTPTTTNNSKIQENTSYNSTNDKTTTSNIATTNQVKNSANSVNTVTNTAGSAINQTNSSTKINNPSQQVLNGKTFTNAQIATAATSVKQYVETNKMLPNNVTINGITVSMPSFLELLTTAVLNINGGINTAINSISFGNAPNPRDTMTSGTMSKSEYLSIASNVKSFMDKNLVAPEYAYNTSLGWYFGYQNMVYTYSKIMSYYSTNNKLPTTISVDPWKIVTDVKFTTSQIASAATWVQNYVDTYKSLPTSVTINGTSVSMPSFLQLLTAATINIKNGNSGNLVPCYTVSNAPNPRDTMTSGNMLESEYLSIANNVNSFINKNNVAPEYAYDTSLGWYFGFQNMVYTYSKIMSYYATNKALPNYVSVNAWSSIDPVVSRPVYITSDNIINTVTDTNTINTIVNALKSMGITAVNAGLGPNTHYSILENNNVPANALIVDIYGGADAGLIYEMGQNYYKQLVASKKVFCVWMPPAVNITGMTWLPRAHDDNYDPSSFTGIANPAQYLLNNGYNYIYSADLNAIISAIYKEATS